MSKLSEALSRLEVDINYESRCTGVPREVIRTELLRNYLLMKRVKKKLHKILLIKNW